MTALPDARTLAWNTVMSASPGALDLVVDASRISGAVPPALRGGRLLSNGPGWTHIGGRMAHPFDGHGYVRAFSFEPGGSLRLRARFVTTPAWQSETAAQRLTHRGLGTNVGDRFWQNLFPRTGPRNVANTTITRWNGRLLAGWEGGAPYGVDPDSLETLGEETLGGALAGQATLAHFKHDAAHTRVAKMPGSLFAHDFVLTPSWYVLASNPLTLRWGTLAKSMLGGATLMDAIASDASAPGAVYLVPRRSDAPVRTVALPDRAFVVHYGNAFEQEGAVTLDACLFHAFTFGAEFGFQGPHAPLDPGLPDQRAPQRLFRIEVPRDATSATWRQLAPHGVDFPRVHPAHEGRRTPLLFGAARADVRFSDPFDSVLRVDLEDPARPPQVWTPGNGAFVGEPVFVPSPEREDEGHVLVVVSDGAAGRSSLVVLDAAKVDEGPLAQVPLPLLPYAFHGSWDRPG